MAYAAVSDVQSLLKARTLGQGKNPTSADVTNYLSYIASELDAILVDRGYTVPISNQYPEAFGLMVRLNALGAAMMTEEASPSSVNVDRLRADYEQAKQQLLKARTVMDAPQDMERASPRGPGVTSFPSGQVYDPQLDYADGTDPCNSPLNPLFSRQQRF